MKYMYSITYKKANSPYNFQAWYGGDTELEARNNCYKSVISHHNKYNKDQISKENILITKIENDGEYNKVLNQLQNDMS